MKINKRYFLILITILMLSFVSANLSSFTTDSSLKTFSEISCDKDALKKDKDDQIITSSFVIISNFKIKTHHYYVVNNYSYLDTNQLLRPPIFI